MAEAVDAALAARDRVIEQPGGGSAHGARHYASLLLRANTPPIVVVRPLVPLNIETTLRMYAHVTDDFMDHQFRGPHKLGFLTALDLFIER